MFVTRECSSAREGDKGENKGFFSKILLSFQGEDVIWNSVSWKKKSRYSRLIFPVKVILCWRDPWKSIEGKVGR